MDRVLILILMEYSQTSWGFRGLRVHPVLILILMEYSQTFPCSLHLAMIQCLNPYSNGILTDLQNRETHQMLNCLNPYSNGILTDWPMRCLRGILES